MKAAPFRLTNPTTARPTCAACGKQVKDMSRHAGTAACSNEARRSMITRLGLVEVWFQEKQILTAAGIAVTVIRDQRGKGWRGPGSKPDKRRWYADPGPVTALRALREGGLEPKRIARLLNGPVEELDRELAVLGLAGKREPRNTGITGLVGQSLLETSKWTRGSP